jgi:hypothetical protein
MAMLHVFEMEKKMSCKMRQKLGSDIKGKEAMCEVK